MERFIAENFDTLKALGYNNFVVQSEQGKTAKESIEYHEGLVDMMRLGQQGDLDLRTTAFVEDTQEIIRVIRVASQNSINVIPSTIDALYHTINDIPTAEGVFAYMGADYCHKMKEMARYDAVFFYSAADIIRTIELHDGMNDSVKAPVKGAVFIEDISENVSIDMVMGDVYYAYE